MTAVVFCLGNTTWSSASPTAFCSRPIAKRLPQTPWVPVPQPGKIFPIKFWFCKPSTPKEQAGPRRCMQESDPLRRRPLDGFGERYSCTRTKGHSLTAGLFDINDKDKTKSTGKLYPAAELKKRAR
jgi:hypothetical protein